MTLIQRQSKTLPNMRKVKNLMNRMFKDGTVFKDMKQYLIPRYSQAGSLKGNPKPHKKNVTMSTTVNRMKTLQRK